MIFEFKPFLKEKSHFFLCQILHRGKDCNSIGMSTSGFKIKGNTDDGNTSNFSASSAY